jgi:hypothetical protein
MQKKFKTFQIKYHSFECRDNFVVVALLHLEGKKVLYIFSRRFLHHLKWNKNEKDMGLKIKKVKVVFFSKTLKQNITNVFFLLFMVSSLILCFWCLKKICNPSICTSNDIKIVIELVKEWKNTKKLQWFKNFYWVVPGT